MPPLEISIPTTSTSPNPSPHTVYHLTLRLPLRTFTLSKRYSDFAALHGQLTTEAGSQPPAPLPPKTFLGDTLRNPISLLTGPASRLLPAALSSAEPAPTAEPAAPHPRKDAAQIESRRQGLEAYLRAINDAPDPRWRNTACWRAFLNLPASIAGSAKSGVDNTGSASSTATTLHATATAPREPIADPVAWLDAHRELKALLHAARAAIASRDSGDSNTSNDKNNNNGTMVSSFTGSIDTSSTPAAAHEAATTAKKHLVRANGLLSPLERGLAEHGSEWSRKRLGEGEVRRRRDLLAAAKHEISSLESLLTLVRRKGEVDGVVEGLRSGSGSGADSQALFGHGTANAKPNASTTGTAGGVRQGRVLGKETSQTRALDNAGVLQLQSQLVKEQDEDLDVLTQVLRRQRELGQQINQELQEQSELLDLLDEDVDRVTGKVKVAKKRADGIS